MVIPDKSIVIQFVNFIFAIVVLNFLLFKPIREVIKKRKELVADRLGSIEKFSDQAEVKVKDYEAALDAARKEGMGIRNQYKDEGVSQETGILSAAGQEAAATLKAARSEIAKEADSAMGALKGQVDAYAKKATEKILG